MDHHFSIKFSFHLCNLCVRCVKNTLFVLRSQCLVLYATNAFYNTKTFWYVKIRSLRIKYLQKVDRCLRFWFTTNLLLRTYFAHVETKLKGRFRLAQKATRSKNGASFLHFDWLMKICSAFWANRKWP